VHILFSYRSHFLMLLLFPIDLICLDANDVIVSVQCNIRPGKIVCAPKGTRSIIECLASPATVSKYLPGDHMEISIT